MSFLNKSQDEESSSVEESKELKSYQPSTKELELTNRVNEYGLKLELIDKIHELDGRYKEGIQAYTQQIQNYNIEIKTLKKKLESEERLLLNKERTIFVIESSIKSEESSLEKLHFKFEKRVDSLYALQNEYKSILDTKQYEESRVRKEQDIEEVLLDLEELELSLLNKELERLNLLALLEPKRKELKELKSELERLELKKEYFESTALYNQNTLIATTPSNIEDVEILETTKE